MPLFQPSNITPSSFAGVGGGTVADTDNVKITWQVNGNVPMTAFKIDIYDMSNNRVHSSGILTDNTPFYPTDRKGNPQYFSYEPNKSWSVWTNGSVTNGDEYTLQITQYWGGTTIISPSVTQFSQSSFIARANPTLEILTESGIVGTIQSTVQQFKANYTQQQGDSIDWVRWKFYQTIYERDILLDDTGVVNTQVLSYTADNMQSGNSYKLVCTVQTENGVQVSAEYPFSVQYNIPEIEGYFGVKCYDEASNLLSWDNLTQKLGDEILGSSSSATGYVFEDNAINLTSGSIIWNNKNDEPLNIPFSNDNTTIVWKGEAYPNVGFSSEWAVGKEWIKVNDLILGDKLVNTYTRYGDLFLIAPNGAQYGANSNKVYTGVIALWYQDNEWNTNFISLLGGTDIYKLLFSKNGKYLIIYDEYGLKVYSVDTNNNKSFLGYTLLQNDFGITSKKSVEDFAFSPNGEYLVVAFSKTYSGDSENRQTYYLESYKISDNKVTLVGEINFPNKPTAVAFVSNTKLLVSASVNYVYSNNNGVYKLQEILLESGISGILFGQAAQPFEKVTFSPSGRYGILLSKNSIYVLDTDTLTDSRVYVKEIAHNSSNYIANDCSFYDETQFIICWRIDNKSYESSAIGAYTIDGKKSQLNTNGYLGSTTYATFLNAKKELCLIGVQNYSILMTSILPSYANTILSFGGYTLGFRKRYNGLALGIKTLQEINISIMDYLFEDYKNKKITFFKASKSSVTFVYNGTTYNLGNPYTPNDGVDIDEVVLSADQICEYVYIVNGTFSSVESISPIWDSNTYFLTNFDKESLNAGQEESLNVGIDIYRENISNKELQKLYSADNSINQVKDFSWITNQKYNYIAYARIGDVYTGKIKFNQGSFCRNQPYYLLIEATQDEENPNTYHALNYWRFGNNIQAGSVSNNNTPNFLNNFTGYRLKQPTSRKGKSGTLTSLLSNAKNNEYKDTVKQMEELYALSESNNTFFLKDMKGNLYMVAISNAITQTINTKSAYQEVTISIPWEEVGSSNNISIIQVPTDDGWVIDNSQLAEVRFKVDTETGTLSSIYPNGYNYNVTFGMEQENLLATTHKGEPESLELVDGAVIFNKEEA